MEDERAGEEGKGTSGGSGAGGTTPGAVPCSKVLEAHFPGVLPLPSAGLEMFPTAGAAAASARPGSARLGFSRSCVQQYPEPQSQGVSLSGGAVTTREGFSVQIFPESNQSREKSSAVGVIASKELAAFEETTTKCCLRELFSAVRRAAAAFLSF